MHWAFHNRFYKALNDQSWRCKLCWFMLPFALDIIIVLFYLVSKFMLPLYTSPLHKQDGCSYLDISMHACPHTPYVYLWVIINAKLWTFKFWKSGQILCAHKPYFLMPGHICISSNCVTVYTTCVITMYSNLYFYF